MDFTGSTAGLNVRCVLIFLKFGMNIFIGYMMTDDPL